MKSSPGGEDTGEGGRKHQLNSCRLAHDVVRANFDLPEFFENLAGNHGSEAKVNAKLGEFFFIRQVNHTPPSRSAVVNLDEAFLPIPGGAAR